MSATKTKICFISLSAYSLFNNECKATFGGAEVQLYQLSKKFAEDVKFEVDFIVGDFGQRKKEKYGKICVRRAFKKVRFQIRFITWLLNWINFAKTIIRTNADVYIQRAAGVETGLICFLSKLMNRKFVFMAAHERDCNGDYIRKNNFSGRIFKYGLIHSDVVVAQTCDQQKMLLEKHNIKAHIVKSSFEIPKQKADFPGEYILFVSRRDKWKQPEIFIDIAGKLAQNNFVMIANEGDDKQYANRIKEMASKVKNIKFISQVSLSESEKYFSNAKLFINTSISEGFPSTFIQSATHGVPILSLNVNPDGIFDKYKIGLHAKGNVEALIDYILLLYSRDDLYNEISANVYSYAKNNHDIAKSFSDLMNIVTYE